MPYGNKKPKTVVEYINSAPNESREKLRDLRKHILAAVPGGKESLKWNMPAISYKRILVMYAGYKKHVGFYPTSSAIKKFSKELSKFNTRRGSIQFPLNKGLPVTLIKKITKFRVKESLLDDKKWRTVSTKKSL